MSKSVLIVDDSSSIRAATRIFVEKQLGLEVCGEAVDGCDAVDKVCELSPDLVIMDFQMPRMNGMQASRKIRNLLARVPIILFTMFADAITPQDARDAGISAVVCKTNLAALQQRIESCI
jgi:DNA-binding NarL/FixJ family response regulator